MIDWTDVLMNAGIDCPHNKDEFSIKCPFHEDRINSCSINVDKGVWICFAGCGAGKLKGFLGQYLNLNTLQLDALLREKEVDFNIDIFDDIMEDGDEYLPIVEFPFKTNYVPQWILDRGFNKEILMKWGCGSNTYNDLIIPVRDVKSRLVGWISRRTNAYPKYMYSKGLKKSKLLFGECHLTDNRFVCLTEGPLDTMWLDQQGYGSVALLGAVLSSKQREMLYNIKTNEFVLCLDNDSVGQKAINKIFKELSQSYVVSYIELPHGYKDVQDIKDKNVLCDIIENRLYW